jgi:hypothetical protein
MGNVHHFHHAFFEQSFQMLPDLEHVTPSEREESHNPRTTGYRGKLWGRLSLLDSTG